MCSTPKQNKTWTYLARITKKIIVDFIEVFDGIGLGAMLHASVWGGSNFYGSLQTFCGQSPNTVGS